MPTVLTAPSEIFPSGRRHTPASARFGDPPVTGQRRIGTEPEIDAARADALPPQPGGSPPQPFADGATGECVRQVEGEGMTKKTRPSTSSPEIGAVGPTNCGKNARKNSATLGLRTLMMTASR